MSEFSEKERNKCIEPSPVNAEQIRLACLACQGSSDPKPEGQETELERCIREADEYLDVHGVYPTGASGL